MWRNFYHKIEFSGEDEKFALLSILTSECKYKNMFFIDFLIHVIDNSSSELKYLLNVSKYLPCRYHYHKYIINYK